MPAVSPRLFDLLRLTMTPGLGPVLVGRLLETFGSVERALHASPRELERVRGIGAGTSTAIARGLKESASLAERELELAEQHSVSMLALGDDEYPPLLASIPAAPPVLYVRGRLRPADADAFPVAIVGSRACTAYGVEQAERFAGVLASNGLTVVSGGARGIDSAAHRGALRSGGRTIVVLGCGLVNAYPPDNAPLYDKVAEGSGAIVSELPMGVAPTPENFPARNRIISGLSLGVLVIEAAAGSGALITARHAAEEQGREVMALPGRVDSPASAGSHDLIKRGGAALVTGPADVVAALESAARHLAAGTHAQRFADPAAGLFEPEPGAAPNLSEHQQRIVGALGTPRSTDELVALTDLSAADLRVELTMLEIAGRVRRVGTRFERTT
ncbi:MAG: DNA-processing protein DprA [Phycisphaeraceae bacterium]|nr:DNA-processing protein DprA [Phycisphaeraceae bacterium]